MIKPWRVLEKRVVLERPPWFTVGTQDVELPDGTVLRDFNWIAMRPFAIVVPLLDGERTILARSFKLGVGDAETQRTALTWLVPAIALALIFTAHLVLLLRDQRRTRVAEAPTATDPLLVLLEEVRAGRVTVERAAATIRGPLA